MLRTAVRLTPTFIFPIFRNRGSEFDYNKLGEQILNNRETETGWDRVRTMFSVNEYDEPSNEITTVGQTALCGAFLGAMLGGFLKSQDAYINFIENNQATTFKTTMEAKKKLQNYVAVAFAKGAYHWGWRLGLFSGTFSLIATVVSVYQDDTTLTEYVTAGAITGALYKANLGLPGMAVGALVGSTLSTIAGAAIIGLLKVTGATMNDIRRVLSKVAREREDVYKEAIDKAATEGKDALTEHHAQVVKERGVQNIDDI